MIGAPSDPARPARARRTWPMRSKPLPSGSIRSSTTKSVPAISRSAPASVAATQTVNPSRRSEYAMDSAIAGSSSTTRIFGMARSLAGRAALDPRRARARYRRG